MIPDDANVVQLTEYQHALALDYMREKKRAAEASDAADALRDELQAELAMGFGHDVTVGVVGEGDEQVEMVRLSVVYSRRLDTTKLRESVPTVYDQFATYKPSVRLTVPHYTDAHLAAFRARVTPPPKSEAA